MNDYTPLKTKKELLKGDKILWGVVILISILSIFPVYSASSNLEYIVNNGTTLGHIAKHIGFIIFGLLTMRVMSIIKYHYIGKLSVLFLVASIGAIVWATFSGQTIDGASAARWVKIPIISISFQPSTFAYLMLIIYLCRFLTKDIGRERKPWEIWLGVFGTIMLVFLLVAKDNGSTALMILLVSLAVLVVGQMKWSYIGGFMASALVAGTLFILVALNTNWLGGSRIHTWMSRIETFTSSKTQNNEAEDEAMKTKTYQVDQAKAAIVHGGLTGMGPGKSALKQMLPQSASDFIFAIIVEEYGLLGAIFLIFLYFIMLLRIVMIANKIDRFFGTLLVFSIGIMIFVQIAVNIAVAVNLIPVTGQPLPLISYGGSSMLVTYIQLGLVLSVSDQIQVMDEEGLRKKQDIEEINDIA